MDAIDVDRLVKSTINNPNSSRSHCIAFATITNGDNEPYMIVLGDFAGVENAFKCDDMTTQSQFANLKADLSQEYEYLKNQGTEKDKYDGGAHTYMTALYKDEIEKQTLEKHLKEEGNRLPNSFAPHELYDTIKNNPDYTDLFLYVGDKIKTKIDNIKIEDISNIKKKITDPLKNVIISYQGEQTIASIN